ncbi:hypothetical protein M408DRAFT_23596 [Serendipita vermifera MAFF 305830]|uniref:Uncharacterized protein n=1 Tax=Serendipita vermifera MAFF 305830 TaxID=933852 RepID=A0A0C2WQS2_SERVB|nr:hypothetical protein M408DRAFT_23596 [Serendipita vermifera MAFF 305830]
MVCALLVTGSAYLGYQELDVKSDDVRTFLLAERECLGYRKLDSELTKIVAVLLTVRMYLSCPEAEGNADDVLASSFLAERSA